MRSFMLEIEAAQRAPLDQFAVDFCGIRSKQPSIDFCRRTLGVQEDDATIAQRLGVAPATVRAWRKLAARERTVRVRAEAALRAAADALHKIGSDLDARKLLTRDGHKLSQPLYDSLTVKLLNSDQISKIAADAFEACVRALGALGAKDVTLHECGAANISEGEDLIP